MNPDPNPPPANTSADASASSDYSPAAQSGMTFLRIVIPL
jgi:hypothetical protein